MEKADHLQTVQKLQANATSFEQEEKNQETSSLLPPELAFSASPIQDEEKEDLKEEIQVTPEEKETVSQAPETADDESPGDSGDTNSSDSNGKESNFEPFQLKKAAVEEKHTEAAPKQEESLQKQSNEIGGNGNGEGQAPPPSNNNNENSSSDKGNFEPFQLKKETVEDKQIEAPPKQEESLQKQSNELGGNGSGEGQSPPPNNNNNTNSSNGTGNSEPFQLKKQEVSGTPSENMGKPRFQLGENDSGQGIAPNGLPNELNKKMAKAFQFDFSKVKIHKGSNKAKEVGAYAFAQGNEVHFAHGYYQPETIEGQELIGHELAHVKQQAEGRVKPTTTTEDGIPVNDDRKLEKEADDQGKKAARGENVGDSSINKEEKSDTIQGMFSSKRLSKPTPLERTIPVGVSKLINGSTPGMANNANNILGNITNGAGLVEMPEESALPEFTLNGQILDINLENVIDSQVVTINLNINPIVTIVKADLTFTDGIFKFAKLHVLIASLPGSELVVYVDENGVVDPTLTIDESIQVLNAEASINAKVTGTGVTGTLSVGITEPQQITDSIRATEGTLILDLSLGGVFNGTIRIESNDKFFVGTAEVDYDINTSIWSGTANLTTEIEHPIEIYPGIHIVIPAGVALTFDFGYEGTSVELSIPFSEEVSLQTDGSFQAGGLAEGTIVLNPEGVLIIPSKMALAVTGGLTTPEMGTILSEESLSTDFHETDTGALLTLSFDPETGQLTEAWLEATGGFSTSEKRIGRINYAGLYNLDSFTLDGTLELTSEAELDIISDEGSQFSLVMLVNSKLSAYHDESGITAIEAYATLALKQQEDIIAQLEFIGAANAGEEFAIQATITLIKELQILEATATQYGLTLRSGSSMGIIFENGALKQLEGTVGLGVQDTEGELLGGTYTGIIAFDEAQELSISEGSASVMLLRDMEYALGTGRVTINKNAQVEALFVEGQLSSINGTVTAIFEDRAFIFNLTANLDYDMIEKSLTSLEAELTYEEEIELFKKEDSFLALSGIGGSLIIKNDELIQIGGSSILTGKFGTINIEGEAELAWVNSEEGSSFMGSGTLNFTKEATEKNPDKWFKGELALSFAGSEFEASGDIEIGIAEGLSGAASFEVDQEMDPVISASLSYTESVLEGKELWANEFGIKSGPIPLPYGFFYQYGINFGGNLSTTPLDLTGTIGIENWRPGSETFPYFDAQLQGIWGVDFSARLMLFAELGWGVDYFNVTGGVQGGLGIDVPIQLSPLARLVSNEKGVGGEVAFNLSITPVFMAILEAYLKWNIYNLVKGKEVWPIEEKELGKFADIHWEGTMGFGNEEAIAASPTPAAPEQSAQPTASIVPNVEGSLGYGNKEPEGQQSEGQNNTSSNLIDSGGENNAVPDFFDKDSKLGKILDRINDIANVMDALTNPVEFLSLLVEFSEDILKDVAEFAQELVDKLERTGAKFLHAPVGTILKGLANTLDDGLDFVGGVLIGLGNGVKDVIDWLTGNGGGSRWPALSDAQAKHYALLVYQHASYAEYVKLWWWHLVQSNTLSNVIPPKDELKGYVFQYQVLYDHLSSRCQAPGTIEYAHPWETFETIAKMAYGDANYAEGLQQHNPALAEVMEGDKVVIPSKEELGPVINVDPIPIGNTAFKVFVVTENIHATSDLYKQTIMYTGTGSEPDEKMQELVIQLSIYKPETDYGSQLSRHSDINDLTSELGIKIKATETANFLEDLLTSMTLIIENGKINVNQADTQEITPLDEAKPGDTIPLGNHSLEQVAEKIYGHKERAAWIKAYQGKSEVNQPAGLFADASTDLIQLPTRIDMAGMDALPLDQRGLAPQSRIKVTDSDTWSTLAMTAFGDWKKALALSDYSSNAGKQLKNGEELILPHTDQLKSTTVNPDEWKDKYVDGVLVQLDDFKPNDIPTIPTPSERITQPGDTWSGLAEAAYGDFSLFPKLSNYQSNREIKGLVPGSWVVIPKKEDLDNVDPYSLGLSLNGYPLLTEMVKFQVNNETHHVWVEDRRDITTRTTDPFKPEDKQGVWMMASDPFELEPEVNNLKNEIPNDSEHYPAILDVWGMTQKDQLTGNIYLDIANLKNLVSAKLLAGDAIEGELDEIEAKYRAIISWADGLGFDMAAGNLERFLDGVGGSKTIPTSWLRKQRAVMKKEQWNRSMYEILMRTLALEIEDGDTLDKPEIFKSTISAQRDPIWQSELFFASGESYFDTDGHFTLKGEGNKVKISGNITNDWHDKYDWHTGLKADVPFFGEILDEHGQLMIDHRGARDFMMKADWEQTLTGTVIFQEEPAGTRYSFDWDG